MPIYDMRTGKPIEMSPGSALILQYNKETGETEMIESKVPKNWDFPKISEEDVRKMSEFKMEDIEIKEGGSGDNNKASTSAAAKKETPKK